MSHRIGLNKIVIFSFIIAILICSGQSCKRETSSTSYDRLKGYIDTIKVVDSHEHQWKPSDYEGSNYNFYTILANSYLTSDLVSAGAPEFKADVIKQSSLDELWNMYGRYLDFSRNTYYYSQFLSGFRVLYGFDEQYFTKSGIASLSEKIAENYSTREDWYEKSFKNAGFDIMFLDQLFDRHNVDIDNRYFALVFNINSIVGLISERSETYLVDGPIESYNSYLMLANPFELAKKEGFSIITLDDYLNFADHLMKKFLEHGCVAIKNSLAYGRTLDFENVPYEKAKELFQRPSNSLSEVEKKNLQDFMFHWIIKKSIEVDLPIQIHTGYLAKTGILENSSPTNLNHLFLTYPKAKFVLFHGSYPWTGEFIALGKMFPNVYLDLVWLPQISREAANRTFNEMLDCVPYNKFFWGGDSQLIEESTGSLEFAKDVVANVLAARVERGLMTEEVARDVALKIFRENSVNFFKLETKLNRAF